MQKAKFFCENCGEEVPEKARFCKHCGKFFTSVRCPKCGATGPSSAFAKGCPNCGYANGGRNIASPAYNKDKRRLSNDEKKRLKAAFSTDAARRISPARRDAANGALPAWVYAVTAAALSAALLGVYSCIR